MVIFYSYIGNTRVQNKNKKYYWFINHVCLRKPNSGQKCFRNATIHHRVQFEQTNIILTPSDPVLGRNSSLPMVQLTDST